MEMKNERHLPLPRDTVWQALNDPAVLQACIPGCESFDQADDHAYDAVVSASVGPVRARFEGRVTLADLQPPESYSMSFQGQGGPAGFVKGSATIELAEEDGGCTVRYVAKATLGGKLAQLGSRLVDGAARKTANQFFDNFVERMGGAGDAGGEAVPATPDAGLASRSWVWVLVGAGLAVAAMVMATL